MRRTRALRPLLAALLAAAASAGCVTEEVTPDGTPAEVVETKTSAAFRPPEGGEVDLGRRLLAIDKGIGEWMDLAGQPGAEARERTELRQSALQAMVAQSLDHLLAFAADPGDPTRRRIAAKALAFTDDRRATAPLVSALSDPDVVLQTNAAFALSRLHDPDTPLDPLLHRAGSADVDVRSNSLLALWHVLDARTEAGKVLDDATRNRALPVIEVALFDPEDPLVRGNAASAMGALGDARGVDSLTNLLRDKHPYVRTHTAFALRKLGDPRAIRPLVDVIDETPAGPRGAVTLAIAALLERQGVKVPADMPDDQRAWSGFVQRNLPAESPR